MKFSVTLLAVFFLGVLGVQAQLDLNTIMENQAGTQIRDVTFMDDNFGVAIGFWAASSTQFTGILATTEDGGQTWEFGTLANTLFFGAAINSDGEISVAGIYLPTSDGLILRSRDRGATWTNLLFNEEGQADVTSFYHIEYLDDQKMLAVGFDGSILHSTNNGTQWSQVNSDEGWSIWQVRHFNEVQIACALARIDEEMQHRLYKSEDSGLNWTTLDMNVPVGLRLESVEFTENGDLYGFGIVDENFAVARSTNFGDDWTLVHGSDDSGTLKGSYINSQGQMYAAGENGKILTSPNGDDWQEMHTAGDSFIWNVRGKNDNVYFTTSTGRIYKHSNTSTSIEEFANNVSRRISVFHDPANRSLTISGLDTNHKQTLRLSSLEGKVHDLMVPANASIELPQLPKGVYVYALLQNGKQIHSGKLLQN